MLSNPISHDQFQITKGNNWFDIFYPHHFSKDINEIIELFRGVMTPESLSKMDLIGLDKINGHIEVATHADILDQLKGSY